jgi:hypothetical protein
VHDHASSALVIVVVIIGDTGLTSVPDALEVAFKFFIEGPHPRGRHLAVGEMLLPGEDQSSVRDRVEQVARDVLYAGTVSGPEGLASGSDEFEESCGCGEPFPSRRSTTRASYCSSR